MIEREVETRQQEDGGDVRGPSGPFPVAVTDSRGAYRFDRIAPGRYELAFSLVNFAGHAQVRNDDITKIGLYHTEARRLIDVTRQDAVGPDSDLCGCDGG